MEENLERAKVMEVERPHKHRYYHPSVGYGNFIKEYNGSHGRGLVIQLDNGRQWFAPIEEFKLVIPEAKSRLF